MSAQREAAMLLRRAGGLSDAEIDLAEVALALAVLGDADADPAPYRLHLAELAKATAEAAKGPETGVRARADALRRVLADIHGYSGDTESYDDLRNANLMHVIDRRKGLPVALAILYIHAARAQGWTIHGVSFPGHFLLRIDGRDGERAVLDPFNGLKELGAAELRHLLKAMTGQEAELAPAHYTPVGDRAILLRLQNNLKLRLLRQERLEEAVEVLEGMLMIAPGEWSLWQEAGQIHAEIGNLRAASLALEHAVELCPEQDWRERARTLLRDLRTRMN